MPYRIEFTAEAVSHLRALAAREQALIRDAINAQLVHEPTVVIRNHEPLRENDVAPWELRVGELRVFYDPKGAVGIRDSRPYSVLRDHGK